MSSFKLHLPAFTLLAALFFCSSAPRLHASSLAPGDLFTANFGVTPNSSDLLFLFSNTPLDTTGTPILTASLTVGSTTLATIVAPPEPFQGSQYLILEFTSVPSALTITPGASALADFSVINSGVSNASIDITVSGASITALDLSSLVLYDAVLGRGGYIPLGDVTNPTFAIQVAPEVPTAALTGTGLTALLLLAWYRKRLEPKPA